ncbi:MAG TPA: hypothetical protein VLL08_14975 [Kineosporiaceae bacterium]|nr:hypothetical protein [Kineosporiaceae bacterium]
MHFTVARRTATLVAVPMLLATLSAGCSRTLPGPAAPAGIAVTSTALTGTTQPSASATTAAVPLSASWAKTTQFLQIKGSEETGGVEYLEVRQAKQEPVGERFETVALDGPWIKVRISAKAENVPLNGKGGDSGQLRAALAERSTGESDKGFDVAFDQSGQVRKVTWLYESERERTQAAIEDWAGSTQFLQIKSAREEDGVTYLKVRPAEKEILGESFETVTIGGPWTEVMMSALASNVPLGGDPGDADALRTSLRKRQARSVDEGFDISFFGNGEVNQVIWLYVSE